MKNPFLTLLFVLSLSLFLKAAPPDDGKLRIICFGAHPDDCELQAGGVGALWAAQGHHVKFVSVTNGDIGHWREAGGPLALRRKKEVEQASTILGTTVEVLDNHDGELMPTLENRQKLIRLIREWKADLVLSPRPYDYHPDHRNTSLLVQDAAYMVTVPFICPDTPILTKNPVFMYSSDRFQKPYPFKADVAVSIDDVFDQKVDAIHEMASQHYEGGANGSEAYVRSVPAASDVPAASALPAAKVLPGDLVFFAGSDGTPTAPGHVGLVIGKNTMIEAYATGTPVRVSTFGTPQSPSGDGTVVGYAQPWPNNANKVTPSG